MGAALRDLDSLPRGHALRDTAISSGDLYLQVSEHRGSVIAWWKRAMDFTLAAIVLVVIAPLLAVVWLLVSLDGGPAIFVHERLGQGGLLFPCFKFRSMYVDAAERLKKHLAANPDARLEWQLTQKLRHDPRVTALGAFLRASSIDELPQFFNVLRGDMSIVGPRPIIQAEASRYAHRFASYCKVRPGITGLWQVSGRSDVTYRRRVALDMVYIRNQSWSLDLAILLKTIPAVLGSKGSL